MFDIRVKRTFLDIVVNAFYQVADEIVMDIDKDEVRVSAIDASHIRLVRLRAIQYYVDYVGDSERICIRMEDLGEVLDTIKSEELRLVYNPGERGLVMDIISDCGMSAEVNLEDPSEMIEPNDPPVKYDWVITLPGVSVIPIYNIAHFADIVVLRLTESEFVAGTYPDEDDHGPIFKLTIEKYFGDKSARVLLSGSFLEEVMGILRDLKPTSFTLMMKDNKPIKISFNTFNDNIVIDQFLAPRIENDAVDSKR